MKKVWAMVLVLAFAVSLVSGCGQTAGGGVTTIKVWTNDGGGKAVWEQLVSDFNAGAGKEKGIKIEWSTYANDYATTLEVARKNGQLPEIAAVSDVKGFAATGDALALEEMPGGREFIGAYDAELLKGRNVINGVVYNVPATSNVCGLIYNKDLFKAAGIVDENGEALPPSTWEEFREAAKRLTDPGKQVYGVAYPLKFTGFWDYMVKIPFLSSFDMPVYDYDAQTVDFSNFDYPVNFVLSIKKDKSIFPGAESLDNDTARAYFAEGKIGMLIGMSWDVGVLTTQFVANCDWGVAPVPVVKGVERRPNYRDISGSYTICKSANDTDLEKVMAVYKFIFSLESRTAIYENGVRLPCKADVFEKADTSKLPAQFTQFAELLDENYVPVVLPALKLEGDSYYDTFNKVWGGAMTTGEAIADLSARYSAALQKGIGDGSIKTEDYK